jgi:hypothetical protein
MDASCGAGHRRRLAAWLALAGVLALLVAMVGVPRAQAAGPGGCSSAPFIPPPSNAGLAFSRTVGPVGMLISVSGSGWAANQSVIIDGDAIQPDGSLVTAIPQVRVVTTGTDGTFQVASLSVPPPPCGADPSKLVFYAYTPDGGYRAQVTFTYTASPSLECRSSPQVPQGNSVILTGENWEPRETITITAVAVPLSPLSEPSGPVQPLPATQAVADMYGTFKVDVVVPDALRARTQVTLTAVGSGPLYGKVSSQPIYLLVVPELAPTLSLARTSGTVSESIRVTGQQWIAGDTVQIEYCRVDSITTSGSFTGLQERCDPAMTEPLASTTVSDAGTFDVHVKLPANAHSGLILLQARVPNDVFGLTIYAQAVPYTIVLPPPPWSAVHPRLALLLRIAQPAVPAAVLGVLLLAGTWWYRRRQRTSRATV